MARTIALGLLAAATMSLSPSIGVAQEEHVYFINNSDKVAMTGFRLKGKKGIITALHGVTAGTSIIAKPMKGKVFADLELREVDIDRDLALLSNRELDKLEAVGLEPAVEVNWLSLDRVMVMGFPDPINLQSLVTPLDTRPHQQLVDLEVAAGSKNLKALKDRGSPSTAIRVLQLNGSLRPGHSGAPVVDGEWRVLAVGNGGIQEINQGWAVPLTKDVKWEVAADNKRLELLRTSPSSSLFAIAPGAEAMDRSLLTMKESLGPQLSGIAAELRELRRDGGELRLMLRKKDDEAAFLSRTFGELKGNIGAFALLDPDSKHLKLLSDQIDVAIARIADKYSKTDMPVELRTLIEGYQSDAAIARKNYRRVLDLQTDEKVNRLRRDFEHAKESLVTTLMQRGDAFRGLGKMVEAAKEYEQALTVDPFRTNVDHHLATCYLALRRWDDLLKMLDATVKKRAKASEVCKVAEVSEAFTRNTRLTLTVLILKLNEARAAAPANTGVGHELDQLGLPKLDQKAMSRLKATALDDAQFISRISRELAAPGSPKVLARGSLLMLFCCEFHRGEILAIDHRVKESAAAYKEALKYWDAMKLSMLDKQLPPLEIDDSLSIRATLALASAQAKLKEYNEAIANYTVVITVAEPKVKETKDSPLRPDLADAHLGRAVAYSVLGGKNREAEIRKDLRQARTIYESLSQTNPKFYQFKIEGLNAILKSLGDE